MNANPVSTIRFVPGSKGLPAEMARHVQAELARIIARDFTDSDGTVWSERRIAKQLGISQPQLNVIRKWKPGSPAGVGVNALLALSKYEHVSIDALLGRELALPTQQRQRQLDEVIETVDAVTAHLAEIDFVPGPSSKLGKLLQKLERAKLFAIGQRHLDAKVERANAPIPRKKASG